MAISPIMNSGMIQRTDDVGVIKLQEHNRPLTEQQSAQAQMTKKADEYSHLVVTPSDSSKTDTHADAREKGKNSYFFRKKDDSKKKTEQEAEGRVIKKTEGGRFDMKI